MYSDQIETTEFETDVRPQLVIITDALRPVSFANLFLYFMCVLVALAAYQIGLFSSSESAARIAVVVYFFIFALYLLRRLKHDRANVLSPDIAFLVFFTVFLQVYVFFWSFGIVPYSDYILQFRSSIPKSLLVVNLGLLGYIIGYELGGPWSRFRNTRKEMFIAKHIWAVFGVLFMCLGMAMHLSVIGILGVRAFQEQGYHLTSGMREYYGSIAIVWDNSVAVTMFGTIIYCLYSSLRYKRLFALRWLAIIPMILIILVALEGDRGPILYMGAPLLLIRHYFVKPIKWKWLVVITMITLAVFDMIAKGRGVALSVSGMYQGYAAAKAAGQVHWWDSFAEMGGAYGTVNWTTYLVPEQCPYWHGKSWVSALIHSVPFLEGLLTRTGIYTAAVPDLWMTWIMFGEGASGTGFSVAGEGYLNFGLPGAFLECFILAIFMRRIVVHFANRPSPVSAFIFLAIIGPLLRLPRASLNSVTPFIFQALVLALILKLFLGLELLNEEQPEEYDTLA